MFTGEHYSLYRAVTLLRIWLPIAVSFSFISTLPFPSFAQATTTLLSVTLSGLPGNSDSGYPSISADGRYVAFTSWATNLVTGYGEGIFVRDTVMGTTTIASVADNGTAQNQPSNRPTISGDGRYVAFESWATNLVPGDTNSAMDVFLRDTVTGKTTRLSVATDGTEGTHWSDIPAISADGRFVAFESIAANLVPDDTNGKTDVFVRDTQSATTNRVSVADDGSEGNGTSGCSYRASFSASGRLIAFVSAASNLVAEDTNGQPDIFVRDTAAGTTTRVSVATDGAQANNRSSRPVISADGRYVAFVSYATNLVPDDTNGVMDVFVRDTVTQTTTRVSVSADGTQGNQESYDVSVSANGRYVAIGSNATNLVPGDTNLWSDIFVRDMETGSITRISVAADGSQGNSGNGDPSISADGRYVAFDSASTNLVAADRSRFYDIYVRGPLFGAPAPFTFADAKQCLRIASGLGNAYAAEIARLNLETGSASLTLADAVRLARKVAGLEANP